MWSDDFWPNVGGTEIMVSSLIAALSQRGHQFIVVTATQTTKPPSGAEGGIPVHRFGFKQTLLNRDLKQIAGVVKRIAAIKREFKPDVVHYHSAMSEIGSLYHLQTRSAHPAPTLLTLHAMLTNHLRSDGLLSRMARESDWVVAVSEATRKEACALAPELANRSSAIYNGLAWPTIEPTALNFEPPCLLGFGRLVFDKGFDLAIRALVAVRRRYSTARLNLAGDGSARPELEALVATLGLGEAVSFLGWVAPEEIPPLINRSTIVVMPSRRHEAFGLSALQAAQMGRPVVTCRIGGLPEVVQHGETGWLCHPDDASGLTEAILSLLAAPAQAECMGRAARKRARETFSLEGCVEAYDDLYRRLAAPRN